MDLDVKTRDKENQVSYLDKKRLIYCFFFVRLPSLISK